MGTFSGCASFGRKRQYRARERSPEGNFPHLGDLNLRSHFVGKSAPRGAWWAAFSPWPRFSGKKDMMRMRLSGAEEGSRDG
jgi:hypothetical protein